MTEDKLKRLSRLAGESREARRAFEVAIAEACQSHSTRDVMRAAGLKSDSHVRHIRDKIRELES